MTTRGGTQQLVLYLWSVFLVL